MQGLQRDGRLCCWRGKGTERKHSHQIGPGRRARALLIRRSSAMVGLGEGIALVERRARKERLSSQYCLKTRALLCGPFLNMVGPETDTVQFSLWGLPADKPEANRMVY